jgi:peptidoglycan/LPS O-acetylase OafA/YrhL
MSGILVSKSFDTERSRAVFALHRAARIYPAFAICTIITAFVLGPTISTLPIHEYLSDPMTMHWWWHTITLMFSVGTFLSGALPNAPIKGLVNLTMWTLPIEIKCYVLVFVAGICGAIGNRWKTVLTCVIAGVGLSR